MRIRDPHSEAEEPYNLVPLTDMVFNLLIFFMCATTFVQIEKDMKVQLPKAVGTFTPISAAPRQLVVNILEDGTMTVDGRPCDAAALSDKVKSSLAINPEQTVVIRADERSRMKSFADATRICKQAGVRDAKLVYLDDAGKPAR